MTQGPCGARAQLAQRSAVPPPMPPHPSWGFLPSCLPHPRGGCPGQAGLRGCSSYPGGETGAQEPGLCTHSHSLSGSGTRRGPAAKASLEGSEAPPAPQLLGGAPSGGWLSDLEGDRGATLRRPGHTVGARPEPFSPLGTGSGEGVQAGGSPGLGCHQGAPSRNGIINSTF